MGGFWAPTTSFSVSSQPPLKNEKKLSADVDVAIQHLFQNSNMATMSQERLAGLFEGSRSVYAMFGLPVPKWMEAGLQHTVTIPESLNAQPYSQNAKATEQSTKAKGKTKV